MKAQNYIAYYRVSTAKQGLSGLGLEAQKASVLSFISPNALQAEFCDIESGKNNARPELMKALQACKQTGAKLIIAKLDRLSRNMQFIASLMESKISFVCVDMPDANEFTVHIFAALAQQERKMISERTSKALQAKKAQGKKLGTPENLDSSARAKGRAIHSAASKHNENNSRAYAFAASLKKNGLTFNQIAAKLNETGFKTAQGKNFQAVQVQRLFAKYQ
jgi:DNA invertase Pin-like site-specific DNA recombinase